MCRWRAFCDVWPLECKEGASGPSQTRGWPPTAVPLGHNTHTRTHFVTVIATGQIQEHVIIVIFHVVIFHSCSVITCTFT